jgi:hypothetical protein
MLIWVSPFPLVWQCKKGKAHTQFELCLAGQPSYLMYMQINRDKWMSLWRSWKHAYCTNMAAMSDLISRCVSRGKSEQVQHSVTAALIHRSLCVYVCFLRKDPLSYFVLRQWGLIQLQKKNNSPKCSVILKVKKPSANPSGSIKRGGISFHKVHWLR